MSRREDPFDVLGVSARASAEELAAAHRALAKQLHPDRIGGDPSAGARMAEVNAAYDAARAILFGGVREQSERNAARAAPPRAPAPLAGHWLPAATRTALGSELVLVLEPEEGVVLLATASTWASARTRVVLTDRRLLWLLDDAVLGRVRALRLRDVIEADARLAWPRRRTTTLRLRERDGRRHAFAELDPAAGRRIAGAIEAARQSSS
jgi:hypothetical protein